VFVNPDKKFVKLAENGACSVFRYFTRDVQQGFSLLGKVGRDLGEEIFARAIANNGKKL
jgi:hypothetical protein